MSSLSAGLEFDLRVHCTDGCGSRREGRDHSLASIRHVILYAPDTLAAQLSALRTLAQTLKQTAHQDTIASQPSSTSKSACRGIYNEAATILYKEIDYISEGRNADRFRRNFQDDTMVQVPWVYWQLTSPRVITLDYLPGTKITSLAALQSSGIDTATVARRATEAYIVQILKHGFLHSDPHPGNIAVNADGGLIFYDFGMMSTIVPATKERLLDVFYGIYRKDAAQV